MSKSCVKELLAEVVMDQCQLPDGDCPRPVADLSRRCLHKTLNELKNMPYPKQVRLLKQPLLLH